MLTCAGVTTYKAVKLSGARPGQLMAVFGVGGLGHLALQYGKISGATVVAVDVVDDKLELAKELGADYVVNALNGGPGGDDSGAGRRGCGHLGGRHAQGVRTSIRCSARGGTLVFVALPADNFVKLPIFETVLRGITIVGSIVGTRKDLAEVYAIHAQGRTRVIRESRKLDEVTNASKRSRKDRSRRESSSTYADVDLSHDGGRESSRSLTGPQPSRSPAVRRVEWQLGSRGKCGSRSLARTTSWPMLGHPTDEA